MINLEQSLDRLGKQTHWISSESGDVLILTSDIERNLVVSGKTSRAESGGVLVGERKGSHFVITDLTMPMPADVRGPVSIRRSPKGHVDFIERIVSETNGRLSYCGEWHTHPQRHPSPSSTDISTWIKLNQELGIPLINIIAGTVSISAYQVLNSKVVPLTPVFGDE